MSALVMGRGITLSFNEELAILYEGEEVATVFNNWSSGQFENLTFSHTEPEFIYETWQKAHYAKLFQRGQLDAWGREVVERLISEIPNILDSRQHRLPRTRIQSPRAGYVYLLQSPTGAYKIGRSRNPQDRLRTFQIKLPFEVEYVCVIRCADMVALEAELHRAFEHKRLNGEWFALTGNDIEFIKGLAQ